MEMAELIFNLVMGFVEVILLMYFIHDFRLRKGGQLKQYLLLFFLLYVGIFAIAWIFAYSHPIKYLIINIFLIFLLKCFYRETLAEIFLYTVIYDLAGMVSVPVMESLFKVTSFEVSDIAYIYTEFTYTLLARFIEFMVLFLFSKFLKKIVFKEKVKNNLKLVYVQCVVSVVCFIVISSSLYGTRNITTDYARLLFVLSFFVLFSALFSVIYFEYYINAVQKNMENEAQLEVKQKQCEIYKSQIEDSKEIRSLYHDMKNHLIILENSRPEEYKEYLQELKTRLDKHHTDFHTGNAYLDILLRDKKRICRENGICFDVSVNFLDVNVLEPVEVCIICGNLLDNAIEASMNVPEKEKRFIEMVAHRMQTNYVIKIVNAYQKEPCLIKGKLFSLKENRKYHGYGVENVQQVISKKSGFYSAKAENGVYKVYVVLPL